MRQLGDSFPLLHQPRTALWRVHMRGHRLRRDIRLLPNARLLGFVGRLGCLVWRVRHNYDAFAHALVPVRMPACDLQHRPVYRLQHPRIVLQLLRRVLGSVCG